MLTNFTLQDILGSSLAWVLFSLIFIAPGALVGGFLDLFDFRRRSPALQVAIAIVLSMAISPIISFWVYHFMSGAATIALFILIGVASAIILLRIRQPSAGAESKRLGRTALLIAAGWVVFSILFLVDIQWGARLYYNNISYDFTTRAAIINAMTRTGVPPINPSYYPGHPVRLTYLYYFWYIPGSVVAQMGSPVISGYTAMIGSVSWCGLGLMAVIALYLRLRDTGGNVKVGRSALLGIGLLLISGVDVLPALLQMITTRLTSGGAYPDGDIEHWNEQITAWIGSVAWAPHHVAALIACLAAVMLIHTIRGQTAPRQLGGCVVAGLALASAIGLSVYVTLIFVFFWGLWMGVFLLQRESRLSLFMALTGALAVSLASPFLAGLAAGNASPALHGLPVTLSVRSFIPALLLFSKAPPAVLNLVFLLLLPINYLMELGFFFVTGLLWIRQHWRESWKQNPFHVSEILLLAVTAFAGSFVQSTTLASNDLGWRAWLPGQFVLLVWSVDVLGELFPGGWRNSRQGSAAARIFRPLRVFAVLGLLTTITDVVLLRTWPMLVDAGITGFPSSLSPDRQLGKRTFAARQAYEYIDLYTPADILIQDNPADLLNRPIGLYSDRAIAISGHTAFGVPAQELRRRVSSISKIFASNANWAEIDQDCASNSVNVMIATDLDAVWKELPALEQRRDPLYQNQYYAVFECGD